MKSSIQEILIENIKSDKTTGITFIDDRNTTEHLSYKKLYLEACYKLHSLQEIGLKPGDELVFQFESNKNFVITFWACVFGKIIPVPIAYAASPDTIKKISGVLEILNNPYIITDNIALSHYFKEFKSENAAFNEMLEKMIIYDELSISNRATPLSSDPSDVVFIQFSSGSTGFPKGVTNTHEALISYVVGQVACLNIDESDRFLGWVPLIHDMGLIFFHLLPLLSNNPQFLMPPSLFLTYPELWLESLSRNEITISGSPNFGYKMILENLDRFQLENLSLSQLRMMFNAAEPVSIDVCKKFVNAFASCGLSKKSVSPAYGLAEAVLGVSVYQEKEKEIEEYLLDRNKLNVGDQIEFVEKSAENAASFANLGNVFPFIEMKITAENGDPLPERRLGVIHLKGKTITKEFYNNPTATRKYISDDGWLNTGDVGFIDNKNLFITGREKEMILINGKNYFPNDLDSLLEELPEIRFQQAISCNVFNENTHTDEIFVFIVFKGPVEEFLPLSLKIGQQISSKLGIAVSQVIAVDRIPKTTSGKPQRYQLRDNLLSGKYDQFLKELDAFAEQTERPAINVPYVAPTTELEKKLAKIWEDLLGFEVGLKDDFFQLGGDSLKIIKLISLIQEEFSISIEVSEVFRDSSFSYQLNKIIQGATNDMLVIEKAEEKEYYTQSKVQKRFFILNKMHPELLCYNILGVANFNGETDFELFDRLFQQLIQKHEMLRTSFHVIDGEPVQKIHETVNFQLQQFQDENEEIDEIIRKIHQPFDLESAPLMRAGLCKRNDNTFCLIIDVHHIVLDQATIGLIFEDFQLFLDETQALPPSLSKVNYVDFSEWQQTVAFESSLNKKEAFWLNEFKTMPDSLNLPTDFSRSPAKNYNCSSVIFELNEEENTTLLAICQEQKVTMYTLLLSCYYVLLSKLSSQEDIVVGTTVLGRYSEELQNIIGVFINTLPIRCKPIQNQSFKDFLLQVKHNTSQCFGNQEYPFEQLTNQLGLKTDLYQNPLFKVMFEYYGFQEPSLEMSNAHLSAIELLNFTSEFDFCMKVSSKSDNRQVIHLEYRNDLFKETTIERFVTYFRNIIGAIGQNLGAKLSHLDFLPESEKKLLIKGYNDTRVAYNDQDSLVSLFERQVDINMDAVAVVYQGTSLTYKELNARSNQVAHYLVNNGIMPGTTIGLLLDRSHDVLVGILGILKAGGGYLPLDPELPEQRIKYMLDNSRSSFLLSNTQYLEEYTAYLPVQAINAEEITRLSTDNLELELVPDDLAYCIFTSGSSGRPKGVMMNQRSVINLVKGLGGAVYSTYGSKKIRVALLASFSFDASIQQIFASLLQGHCLYITDEESRRDGTKLRNFYNSNAIELSDGTPTHLRLFINALDKHDSLESLSNWILAGEVLSKELVRKFQSLIGENVQLYNFYGPTETCVDSTAYKIDWNTFDAYDSIPIGKPLPNERVYITDTFGNLVPTGTIGELCIAGDGLAQRYVGNEALTTEKFDREWIEWEDRVYRTGDLTRWLPDGNLAYHGRIDDQIKIRGYRIELSEIMYQLDTHSEVDHSTVVVREQDDDKFLIVYYESITGKRLEQLRNHLEQLLPDYMIPSHYVHMECLPLTINGKVDQSKLPDYKIIRGDDHEIPSTDTELKLVHIWSEILKVEEGNIGISTNFFELGGNSLKMVLLDNKIQKEFNVKISLREFTKDATIKSLSAYVLEQNTTAYSSILPAPLADYYSLSSSQKRLYFLNEFEQDSTTYNQLQCYELNGILDSNKLTNAFRQVITRHESLRTYFELCDGEPVQYILDEVPFEFEHYHSSLNDATEVIMNFVRPFDLQKAPLLRVGLIHIADDQHILMLDTHHIISDGVSRDIFFKDLVAFYQDQTLSPLRLQYKDYAVWQQAETHQKSLEAHKQFWTEMFAELPSVIELPIDRPRPKVTSYDGHLIGFTLESGKVQALRDIAKTSGSTMFMVFLTLYKILLYKLTGQKDLVVGTSVAGRNHDDIEGVMGIFINALPLRNQIQEEDYFSDLLLRVNDHSLSSFEHQDYPYETLIDDLNITRDTSRNPLFDVMLEYANFEQPVPEFSGLSLRPYDDFEYNVAKIDLTLHAREIQDHMELGLQYSTDLFDKSTIERFVDYFKQIVEQVTSAKDIQLKEINPLSEGEQERLVALGNPEITFKVENDIVSLFEAKVAAYPSRRAVSFEGTLLSYEELNKRSNQVAHYLLSKGIKKGDIVGLLFDRSLDMIIGILGVLKSGAAYLPIDPNLPFERISYLLKSSGSKQLVGHEKNIKKYGSVIETQAIQAMYADIDSTKNLNIKRSPSDLAYCIYTSGSTGVPKGVMMEHGAIVNLVEGLSKTIYSELEEELRVALLASYSFDASCQQIFGALLQGHSLFIIGEEQRMDGWELYNFYKENAIEVSDGTPTHLGMFLGGLSGSIDLPDLKRWLLAGEALSKELAQDFYSRINQNVAQLYNLYGPTETCVDSSYYHVDSLKLDNQKIVPIGRPLPNEQVYIADSFGYLVPHGVVGELCIAGEGLARGYINKENEKDRFVANWVGEDRVYRTGDLARWLPDGNLEYCGRRDNQVKLRGYRIELKEIEHKLLSHPEITGGTVLLRTIEEEAYLVAYYVSGHDLNSEELREHLLLSLPEYMVPSSFVKLDMLPVTSNGKLDRNALLNLETVHTENYQAPSTENEKRLQAIWSDVLKIDPDQIGVTQNFFDLGGHSIKAMQLASRIKQDFGIDIKLAEVFIRTTIVKQASFIDTNQWLFDEELQETDNLEINL